MDDYTLEGLDRQDTKLPTQSICDQCEEKSRAVSYCSTCSECLCEECLGAHKRLRVYRSHEIESLTQGNVPDCVTKRQSKRTYNCAVHPDKSLEVYCKTCNRLACIACITSKHNRHDIRSIDSKERKEVEEKIEDFVKRSATELEELEQNLQYVSAVEKDKLEELTPLKAKIDKKVDSLISQLEARRTELHKEVDAPIKELWAQKEYYETNIVSLKGALNFARRSLKCQKDIELLALGPQVTSRMRMLNWHKSKIQSVERIEMSETKFTEGQTANQLPGYNQRQVRPPKLAGEIETHTITPDIHLNSDSKQLSVEFQPGCSISFQVSAVIKIKGKEVRNITSNLLKGSVTCSRGQVNVERKQAEPNCWTVTFAPSQIGQHKVTFKVDGMYGGRVVRKKHTYYVDAVQAEPLEQFEDCMSELDTEKCQGELVT